MRRVAAREIVEFDFLQVRQIVGSCENGLTAMLDFETKAGR
jgi:hypothetical protein